MVSISTASIVTLLPHHQLRVVSPIEGAALAAVQAVLLVVVLALASSLEPPPLQEITRKTAFSSFHARSILPLALPPPPVLIHRLCLVSAAHC